MKKNCLIKKPVKKTVKKTTQKRAKKNATQLHEDKITKIYVVTAVDVGDSCDGHARVLGAFKSKDDAKNYVRNDMEDRCDQLANTGIRVDFDQMEIVNEDEDTVCCWSIAEVEVQ